MLAAAVADAQVPRAEAVDPALATDPAQDFFLRGKNLYDVAQSATDLENRRQMFQQSAQIFAEYLTAFPDHPNAERSLWYLGNSYYQSGLIEDGKRCFATLLNRYEKGVWAGAAAYTLAADHYNKADYASAAPMFERYAENVAKPEERPRGYYYAGNCYRLLGRNREAAVLFRKVIEDPSGGAFLPQARLALAQLALTDGRFEDALSDFEQLANSVYTPKIRGEALLNAAAAAEKLQRMDVAERFLNQLLHTPGMEEFQVDAQTALMKLFFDRKDFGKVVAVFKQSSQKAEGEKEAVRLMLAARSHMKLKQPSTALGLFREIERIVKPQNDLAFQAAYYRLLCFFQIEGQHLPDQVDAFLQLYRKSRPDDPRIHTALMMKAESLFAQKQVAEAAKAYGQIRAELISEKNRPGLLYQRGWCLAEAGDAVGAVNSLSEFIRSHPDDSRVPSALAKRAKAYVDTSESAKAIEDFDRLTQPGSADEFVSYAWLESARLRRSENQLPDMIARYRGLLANGKSLSANIRAEANYWIGWGLVKTNAAKDAVEPLQTARQLRPDAYRKHAGILLALGYYSAQDAAKLAAEIQLAFDGNYVEEIPDQVLQWSGIQSFNARDFALSEKSLAWISTPEDPRATPKEVWRYLAKARLETGNLNGALEAADRVLAVEDHPAWKADGLLDRATALFRLNRFEESRKSADDSMALRPQGRTSAALRILMGDLEMQANDPKKASAEYLIVVNFHEDRELKPLALSKLIQAFEKQNDMAEAENYRKQLESGFPDWKNR